MEGRKRLIVAGLLLGGLGAVAVPVWLGLEAASKVSIIGGVGLPTFWYKFTTEAGGTWPVVAAVGVIMIIAGAVLAVKRQ